MADSIISSDLPPLPDYTLQPLPALLSPIPDKYLTLVLPVAGYWALSLFFHLIDAYDLFPQFRLHTPAELLKRNHASKWDVFRDVVIQQIIQTIFGLGLAALDPNPTYGKEGYDTAVWAQRIRLAQAIVPTVLAFAGLDAGKMSGKLAHSYPTVAAILSGGHYQDLTSHMTVNGRDQIVPAFAAWELVAAKAIYWWIIPALQFGLAVFVLDTWQYFWHRAMHTNKWLYTKFHSRHHRLYVPYAYGALYNHPVEGFLLDTLGSGVAYLIAGMSIRQSMWFFTGATIKTVDDHCGYSLPFDPLQIITTNNAPYHDIHHQSWGIKTNFSQPFFTFWDSILGTKWTGGDVKLRYEKSREAAEQQVKREKELNSVPNLPADPSRNVEITALPIEGSTSTPLGLRRSPRKKSGSISNSTGSLKGLRDRVNQNLQGRGGNVLGVESSH